MECLRVEQPGNVGATDEMVEPPLAFLKVDVAQVIPIVVQKIERPQHEVVLDALVHLSVERFEAVIVD